MSDETVDVNPLIMKEIEFLKIPNNEKDMLKELLQIEKMNRDKEQVKYTEMYQVVLSKYTEHALKSQTKGKENSK